MKRLIFLTLALLGTSALAQTAWYCPNTTTDYMSLFQPGAAWPNALAKVKIFKLYPNYAVTASEADLQTIFAFLNQHGIALALEWELLTETSTCGSGVESYDVPNISTVVANRIKANGGNLQYVAMDEPVYYGHYYTGQNACNAPLASLAQQVAVNIKQIQAVFPNVQVGEIEPFGAMPSTWAQDFQQWLPAYQAAVGKPLAFVHDDMIWSQSYTTEVQTLQAMLTAANIPFGVILNGGPGWSNSSSWMVDARKNIRQFNALGFATPAHVIFQSWDTYPSAQLPETSSTTLTSLIDFYFSTAAKQPPPVPFYRLYNATMDRHFYTPWTSEKNSLVADGWTSEGAIGYIYMYQAAEAGLTPLYRLFNPTQEDHLFTAYSSERTYAETVGYSSEGVTGYVFYAGSPPGTPVYRAYSPTTGHFWTQFASEYEGLPASMQKEGVSFQLP